VLVREPALAPFPEKILPAPVPAPQSTSWSLAIRATAPIRSKMVAAGRTLIHKSREAYTDVLAPRFAQVARFTPEDTGYVGLVVAAPILVRTACLASSLRATQQVIAHAFPASIASDPVALIAATLAVLNFAMQIAECLSGAVFTWGYLTHCVDEILRKGVYLPLLTTVIVEIMWWLCTLGRNYLRGVAFLSVCTCVWVWKLDPDVQFSIWNALGITIAMTRTAVFMWHHRSATHAPQQADKHESQSRSQQEIAPPASARRSRSRARR